MHSSVPGILFQSWRWNFAYLVKKISEIINLKEYLPYRDIEHWTSLKECYALPIAWTFVWEKVRRPSAAKTRPVHSVGRDTLRSKVQSSVLLTHKNGFNLWPTDTQTLFHSGFIFFSYQYTKFIKIGVTMKKAVDQEVHDL